ncbi:MAG: acetyl-CoA carboxylase biotin carboxylase subunit, partial [Planctomycetaceae bacterium]|nr:acetyl-CoA carboxylase biotin carboxylase subunit [Planctomycetaceae bacterium]
EDPEHDFRGSPGTITGLKVPGGRGIRFDSHVHAGYRVPPYYDSLIGKLIVHRPTRAEAIRCMKRALEEFCVEGIHTTIPLLKQIFNHSAFIDGNVDTGFIERELL